MVRFRWIQALVLAWLLVLSTGCVATVSNLERTDAPATFEEASYVVMPLDVSVYEVSAGGVNEKMDEWSNSAEAHVTAALQSQLGDVTMLSKDDLTGDQRVNLTETQALYQAINTSLIIHQYGQPVDRLSDNPFVFTLGDEVRDLNGDAPYYLFVWGVDFHASAGRSAAKVGGFILGVAVAALTGVNTVGVMPTEAPTGLSAALVDAETGDLLWYGFAKSETGFDLREANSVDKLVKQLLRKAPLN